MGATATDFSWGQSSANTILLYIILFAIVVFTIWKLFERYQEQKKWGWFLSLAKEKKLAPKEVAYLRQIIIKNKVKSTDELFGSLYQLNLPTPIKRKLLQ